MNEQINLFDLLEHDLHPGDWVEQHGRELTFREAAERIGELLVKDCSTESRQSFKIVRIEKCITYMDGSTLIHRIIAYDGHRQRSLLNHRYFKDQGYTGDYPIRMYEVAV